MRQIICRRDDDTARLISAVEQIVKRREKLRLGRAERKIYQPKTIFDRIFETCEKRLTVADAACAENFYAVKTRIGRDFRDDSGARSSVSGGIARFRWAEKRLVYFRRVLRPNLRFFPANQDDFHQYRCQ